MVTIDGEQRPTIADYDILTTLDGTESVVISTPDGVRRLDIGALMKYWARMTKEALDKKVNVT